MIDVASIIVSVISLSGLVLAACIGAYLKFWSDQRKRELDAEALHAKYRDPLRLAVRDLSYRLYNICEHEWLSRVVTDASPGTNPEGYAIRHSCFLLGQYLAWCYILRIESQYLRINSVKNVAAENAAYHAVADTMADTSPGSGPFVVWRGEQWAIGEIMTTTDRNGQLCSMGYAQFSEKWADSTNPSFSKWFEHFERDLKDLMNAKRHGRVDRLRRINEALRNLLYQIDPAATDSLLLAYATSPRIPEFLITRPQKQSWWAWHKQARDEEALINSPLEDKGKGGQ